MGIWLRRRLTTYWPWPLILPLAGCIYLLSTALTLALFLSLFLSLSLPLSLSCAPRWTYFYYHTSQTPPDQYRRVKYRANYILFLAKKTREKDLPLLRGFVLQLRTLTPWIIVRASCILYFGIYFLYSISFYKVFTSMFPLIAIKLMTPRRPLMQNATRVSRIIKVRCLSYTLVKRPLLYPTGALHRNFINRGRVCTIVAF